MQAVKRTRDEWLALRCQSGDAGSFEDLCSEMERPLFYYAAKLIGDQDAALDILQETWIRALAGIRKLKDPSSVRSWLYSIVHSIAVDQIRRERTRQRVEQVRAETWNDTAEMDFTADEAAIIHEALGRLSPEHREVLVLYFLEDFSLAEIARIVNSPEGTVKSRMHHAKAEMKAILSGGGYGRS